MIVNLILDALYYTIGGLSNVLNRLPTATIPQIIHTAVGNAAGYFQFLNLFLPLDQIMAIVGFLIVGFASFILIKFVMMVKKFIPFVG